MTANSISSIAALTLLMASTVLKAQPATTDLRIRFPVHITDMRPEIKKVRMDCSVNDKLTGAYPNGLSSSITYGLNNVGGLIKTFTMNISGLDSAKISRGEFELHCNAYLLDANDEQGVTEANGAVPLPYRANPYFVNKAASNSQGFFAIQFPTGGQ